MNPRECVSSEGRAAVACKQGRVRAPLASKDPQAETGGAASGGQLVAILFEALVTHPAAEIENRQEHPEHPEFFNIKAGILWVRADTFLLQDLFFSLLGDVAVKTNSCGDGARFAKMLLPGAACELAFATLSLCPAYLVFIRGTYNSSYGMT